MRTCNGVGIAGSEELLTVLSLCEGWGVRGNMAHIQGLFIYMYSYKIAIVDLSSAT